MRCLFKALLNVFALGSAFSIQARAQTDSRATIGYPEPILHWEVEAGETCQDISVTLYDSPDYTPLLLRYNDLDCGAPLKASRLLIVPLEIREIPIARLEAYQPEVRARPPEGAWTAAQGGMTFDEGYGVNTLAHGSADIRFVDRSRVLLQENTLVIIYDSASTSPSRSTRTSGLQVAIREGELRAGLEQLWSKPVHVATESDGVVRVSSQDAAISRRADRTAVSVFDGTADVESANTRVVVPEKYGTTFRDRVPPHRPKPLPPAPQWAGGAEINTRVSVNGNDATFLLSWLPVGVARRYRIEVARDAEFRQPILREEVPQKVSRLRLQSLPTGIYHVRIQAVSEDELIGMPSSTRTLVVPLVTGTGVRVANRSIWVGAYTPSTLEPIAGVRWSQEDGAPVSLPYTLGPGGHTPDAPLWLDVGGDVRPYELKVERPHAQITAMWMPGPSPVVRVSARLVGTLWPEGDPILGGLSESMWDIADFQLQLIQSAEEYRAAPQQLSSGQWGTELSLPTGAAVSVKWLDRTGQSLGEAVLPTRTPPREAQVALPAQTSATLAHPLGAVGVPALGAMMPSLVSAAMQAASDGWGERLRFSSGVPLSRHLGVSVGLSQGVGGDSRSDPEMNDSGSAILYYHAQASGRLRVGVRAGCVLPFTSATDGALGVLGAGAELAQPWGAFLMGLDFRTPLGGTFAAAPLLALGRLGGVWRPKQQPFEAFAAIELAGRSESLSSLDARGAVLVGGQVGRTWAGSIALRLATHSDFDGLLGVHTGLTRYF